MCFNYKVSLFTFTLGVTFSILLIYYGNEKYALENTVTGIFLILISFVQFMDFLFWIDLNNKLGINKIISLLGPILNVCQPLFLYVIKNYVYKPIIFTIYNFPIALLNLLYLFYFIDMYTRYLTTSKLITQSKHGHLQWPWINYSNPLFYLILFAINIFYLFQFKYALLFFLITYIFLLLSVLLFKYNPSELWCFFGSGIPAIMFILSFYI